MVGTERPTALVEPASINSVPVCSSVALPLQHSVVRPTRDVAAAVPLSLPLAEAAELTLYCQILMSAPISAAAMDLAHEGYYPALTPAAA